MKIESENLKAWVKARRSLWRQNRNADPENCWQRMNEDTCFMSAIEMMEAQEGEND